MALLIVQGIRGGCERWEVLAMWGWLWTWVWTLPVNRGRFWNGIKALPLAALLLGGLMLLHALKLMYCVIEDVLLGLDKELYLFLWVF